jgi:hypothetical protein
MDKFDTLANFTPEDKDKKTKEGAKNNEVSILQSILKQPTKAKKAEKTVPPKRPEKEKDNNNKQEKQDKASLTTQKLKLITKLNLYKSTYKELWEEHISDKLLNLNRYSVKDLEEMIETMRLVLTNTQVFQNAKNSLLFGTAGAERLLKATYVYHKQDYDGLGEVFARAMEKDEAFKKAWTNFVIENSDWFISSANTVMVMQIARLFLLVPQLNEMKAKMRMERGENPISEAEFAAKMQSMKNPNIQI